MRYVALLCIAALSGCATMPDQNLTADQIKAIVSAKAQSAVCVTVTGVGGTGKMVYVNIDETRVNGSVSVDPLSCAVTMTTTNPPKAATTTPAPPVTGSTPPVTP